MNMLDKTKSKLLWSRNWKHVLYQ